MTTGTLLWKVRGLFNKHQYLRPTTVARRLNCTWLEADLALRLMREYYDDIGFRAFDGRYYVKAKHEVAG